MLACPECRKLYPSDALECTEHRRGLVPLDALPDEHDESLDAGFMAGEYRIDRKLGSGTFGAVYAGEQPLIGKKVAIKVLHRRFASDAGVVSRFVAEARAVNRIRHKNIIDIFSFGLLDDKRPYFVMELLDGMTLGELLDREVRLRVDETLSILRGIADGLEAAHDAGVTHRDLKPDNIFLAIDSGGGHFPKLLDFGVAKLLTDEVAHKTATGAAIGTPRYMAPEQCRGRPVDHRADIYALGVVIHEMLTGRRLFEADSAMDVLMKHISEPPRPMSEVCPDLPKALDAPVMAMLAKNPRQRPNSAVAAVTSLADRAHDSGVDRPPEGATGPSSFERALARREAATVAGGAGRNAEATVPANGGAPALPGSADTSGPVVISVGGDAASAPGLPAPATTADGRYAISSKGNTIKVWDLRTGQAIHTFQGQAGAPAPETPSAPPAAPAAPAPAEADSKRGSGFGETPHRPSRWRPWALVAAGAAILAGLALLRESRLSAPPSTSATTAPSEVTIRLSVTPSNAGVLLDGVPVGPADRPIVLPRSGERHAIRVEKRGFEAHTLSFVPDRDSDLPSIVLRPLSPADQVSAPVPSGAAEPPR